MAYCVNVCALSDYTEYEFVGYSEEKRGNTDLIKYEEVLLNKFYKNIETNVYYGDLGSESVDRPYVDMVNPIVETYYDMNRNFYLECYHTVTLKSRENYSVNAIEFKNFDMGSERNIIYEIEVFVKGQKIDYEVDDLYWLNDDIYNEGKSLNMDSFILKLNEDYMLNDIEISISYKYDEAYMCNFDIDYIGDNDNYLSENVVLDLYLDDYKKTVINVMNKDEFESFMPSHNLSNYDTVKYITQCSYFTSKRYLYKYYNLSKEYYIMSELESLDGYEYDPSESVLVYKIYERKKIENDSDQNTDDLSNNENTNIEKVSLENEKTVINTVQNKTPDVEIIKDEIVKDNPIDDSDALELKTAVDEKESSPETKECPNTNNIFIKVGIILLVISTLLNIGHFISVKFVNKND